MDSKKPWQSKTLIMNAIIALAAFYPPAAEFVKTNTEAALMTLGLIGMILRMVTKGKVVIE
jgi:hypothetical protein